MIVRFFGRERHWFPWRGGCVQHFFFFVFAVAHSTSRCCSLLLSRTGCFIRRHLQIFPQLRHTFGQTDKIKSFHDPSPVQHSDSLVSRIAIPCTSCFISHQTRHQALMQPPNIERIIRIHNSSLRPFRSEKMSRDQGVRKVFGAALCFGADAGD